MHCREPIVTTFIIGLGRKYAEEKIYQLNSKFLQVPTFFSFVLQVCDLNASKQRVSNFLQAISNISWLNAWECGGYFINGYMFRKESADVGKRTQNSGVMQSASTCYLFKFTR